MRILKLDRAAICAMQALELAKLGQIQDYLPDPPKSRTTCNVRFVRQLPGARRGDSGCTDYSGNRIARLRAVDDDPSQVVLSCNCRGNDVDTRYPPMHSQSRQFLELSLTLLIAPMRSASSPSANSYVPLAIDQPWPFQSASNRGSIFSLT